MKINEVEERVGITKRNIRYYEKEGLLSPGRNSENGYRDYADEDVEALKKIKLLRKLDVPLEEIRRMQRGDLTLDDGLRRHIIQLERQRENLDTTQRLCQTLADAGAQLPTLDAGRYLSEMEHGTGGDPICEHQKARYPGPVRRAHRRRPGLYRPDVLRHRLRGLGGVHRSGGRAAPGGADPDHRRPGGGHPGGAAGAGAAVQTNSRRRRRCCF